MVRAVVTAVLAVAIPLLLSMAQQKQVKTVEMLPLMVLPTKAVQPLRV
jgi:hypothetical protein